MWIRVSERGIARVKRGWDGKRKKGGGSGKKSK